MKQILCVGGRCIAGYVRRGGLPVATAVEDSKVMLMGLTIAVGVASVLVVLLICDNIRARVEASRKERILAEYKHEATAREERLFEQLNDYATRELRLLSDLRETTFEKEEAERKLLNNNSGGPLNLFQIGHKEKQRVRSLSEVGADELDSASDVYVANSPGGSLLASQLPSRRNSRAGSVVGSQHGRNSAENIIACGATGGPLPGSMPPPPPPRKSTSLLSGFMDGITNAKASEPKGGLTSPSSIQGDYSESPVAKVASPKRPALAPRMGNEIIWGA